MDKNDKKYLLSCVAIFIELILIIGLVQILAT